MNTQLTFVGNEPFDALTKAHKWCDEHDISYGPTCTAGLVALKRGDWLISKWHNLTPKERAEADGTMSGNFRNGPVFISVKQP